MQVGDKIRAKVEKLVYGGKGLIRHEGWVIFVEDVVAGELVEVELVAKKKSYFEAKLCEVVEPSKLRVKPPCPYFGTCGGCQLQHMAYEEQLRVKLEWLTDALKVEAEIAPAKKTFCYRRKVVLHGPECGFFARDNKSIIPIERCLLFSERGFEDVRKKRSERITVIRDEEDNRTVMYDREKSPVQERQIEGLRIFYSAGVFTQNDPDQALQIYKDVLESLLPTSILELYCGVGIFSLLAAKRAEKVLGVELNAEAIALAKKSKEVNGIKNAEFLAKPCERLSDKECRGYEQWIVNPPRTGLSKQVVTFILRQKPRTLVYISCNPSTLARDIKALRDSGYTIQKAQVYDMFAQTTHLETVVYLSLNLP